MKQITEAKRGKRGAKAAVGAACVVLVLAAAYCALCAVAAGRDTFYPGYRINGVEVGGLSAGKVAEDLDAAMEQRKLSLRHGQTGEMLAEVSLAELGYTREVFEDEVRALLERQQSGPFLKQGAEYLRAVMNKRKVDGWYWPERNEAVYAATVERLAEELSVEAVEPGYVLEGQSIRFTRGQDGCRVDAAALEILRNTNLYPMLTAAEITPETVCAGEETDAQAVYEALAGEMVNAAYDSETDSITPERIGVDFDVEAARRALADAKAGETVTVDARVEYPTVTAEELESLLFRDVLGECRSTVTGEDGRVTNIRLSAAAINGHVLNPGDSFSYNQVVGKRTAARGYKEGPAYVNGKTVMELGGGICQTSSTLYLACLRADLQITERRNHGYVPAYVPWGMDSAVSWGTLDYCFVNNTDYPVKIVTEFDGKDLTVQLLGTNLDGRYAEVTFEVLSTTPWTKTEYVEDPSLAPGSEGVVMVEPYTGARVRTTHTIYDADGNVLDSHYEATSNYKMRNQVIHVPVGEIPVEAAS